MEHGGIGAAEMGGEDAGFLARDEDGATEDGLAPEAAKRAGPGAAEGEDGVEREALGIFALLREDEGLVGAQCADLPVDVEHLRLEKSGAVLSGDGLACGIHALAAFCKRERQAIPKRLPRKIGARTQMRRGGGQRAAG